MDTVIECSALKKEFKINKRPKGFLGHMANLIVPKFEYKQAVSDISFRINRGDAVGFIGANGAGKSTTIKMLTGILAPTEGSITALGVHPQKDRKQYVAKIGAVFGQKSQLSWDLPVLDSFYLLQKIYQIPDQQFNQTLEQFTDILDMSGFIEQPVRQLSLGQRMRADIAASLLHKPELVFFDEPTIGLDVVAKEKIREFVRYLNREMQVTVIFTTHDMQDIEQVCQRLIIIDKGRKLYDGTVEGIKSTFGNEKKLIVQFESPACVYSIPGVSQKLKPNHVIEFSFSSDQVAVKDLVQALLAEHAVLDISITEQGIEQIIREIYEKGI
ncbi:ABC transporter ATP-binding protein [Reinekea marinisedimentorum]|uniref:ABC-2 type transport system ATP-binding protein n=1 Tax=Reinekea marinisedimentorum TaxID=230495 RepID=A0A4V2UIV4_9GAMM|nr:ATP-binding cassette domain-containing protein [Reinekea marinisedimentorum]TCS37590.1 ABC-2 type transport system ATP-binding protein [Reinekea marinisedimentorum]